MVGQTFAGTPTRKEGVECSERVELLNGFACLADKKAVVLVKLEKIS